MLFEAPGSGSTQLQPLRLLQEWINNRQKSFSLSLLCRSAFSKRKIFNNLKRLLKHRIRKGLHKGKIIPLLDSCIFPAFLSEKKNISKISYTCRQNERILNMNLFNHFLHRNHLKHVASVFYITLYIVCTFKCKIQTYKLWLL